MGRYVYRGPFEHKFWFGIQHSNAASQFGGEVEHNSIPYFYSSIEDFNVEQLKKLLNEANQIFGQNFTLDFKDYDRLEELLPKGPSIETSKKLRDEWKHKACLLADIELGLKIYHSILEDGYCSFEAEL